MLNSNLFWFIVTFLSTMLGNLVVMFIFDKSSEQKKDIYEISRKVLLNVMFLIFALVISVMTIFNINPFIKIFINFIVICILYKLNYKVNYLKSILICLFSCLLLIFVDTISSCMLMSIVENKNLNNIFNSKQIKLEYMILDDSILFLFFPIINLINFKVKFAKKEYILAIIPTLVYTLCVLAIFKVMLEINLNTKINMLLLIISFTLFLFNIFTFFLISKIFEYKDLRNIDELIKQKSDFMFKYYSNLIDSNSNKDVNFETDNEMTEAILKDKIQYLNKKNIFLDVKMNSSALDVINSWHLCNIFSNFIDNVIFVCEKTNSKKIKLKGKRCGNSGRMFVMKCELDGLIDVKYVEPNFIAESKKSIEEDDSLFKNMYSTSIRKSLQQCNGEFVINIKSNRVDMIIMFFSLS